MIILMLYIGELDINETIDAPKCTNYLYFRLEFGGKGGTHDSKTNVITLISLRSIFNI